MSNTPRTPAAFINEVAENGTKQEAIEWLQKTWDERCELERELAEKEAALARCIEALSPFSHPDLCMVTSGNVEGEASPVFGKNSSLLLIRDFTRARDVLAALPQSAKRDAEIIRTATKLVERSFGYHSDFRELEEAVTGAKAVRARGVDHKVL